MLAVEGAWASRDLYILKLITNKKLVVVAPVSAYARAAEVRNFMRDVRSSPALHLQTKAGPAGEAGRRALSYAQLR